MATPRSPRTKFLLTWIGIAAVIAVLMFVVRPAIFFLSYSEHSRPQGYWKAESDLDAAELLRRVKSALAAPPTAYVFAPDPSGGLAFFVEFRTRRWLSFTDDRYPRRLAISMEAGNLNVTPARSRVIARSVVQIRLHPLADWSVSDDPGDANPAFEGVVRQFEMHAQEWHLGPSRKR